MANPEQPVLDEIDRLVSWQIEEGQRRGDGPDLPEEDEPILVGGPGTLIDPEMRDRGPAQRLPEGPWWRCDSPLHVWFELISERQGPGWSNVAHVVKVCDVEVARWVTPIGYPLSEIYQVELTVDSWERPTSVRLPRWIALRCPTRPSHGTWREWSPE
ncbi:hypothetical protein [Nocardia sp. NPDC057227]|uniref:hypothetical protein n=1 Tax=Nocardia sp. NPDC057227 TaxID=3346056 RepID=UPI003638D490